MNKEIIDKTIAALRHNHFEVFFAHNTAEASAIFFRDIFPGLPRLKRFSSPRFSNASSLPQSPGAIPKR